jgi:CelD/BcsL family acetyltransferase involved in cellulose biosynthesis
LSSLSLRDASLARAAAEAAGYHVFSESSRRACLTIEGDWDAYLSRLERKFLSELNRRERRIREEGRVALQISDGTDRLNELLAEGFSVEGSGWKDAHGTSIRAQWRTRRFYAEVAQWASKYGLLRLAFLRLNGRAIAFDYYLEDDKTYYLLKGGYDPAFKRFAPSQLNIYFVLARAFSNSATAYDLGIIGPYDSYKQKWTDERQESLSLHMFAPTALGFIYRVVFIGGHFALECTKRLVQKGLSRRGMTLLWRGRSAVRVMFNRR